MAKRHPKKQRTRQHVIADLSANYVERFVLLCGHSVERVEKDYGYDLSLFTYDQNGEPENGHVFIQLKATDNPRYLKDGRHVSVGVESAHLRRWLKEPMPVILVLYDASKCRAYWLYMQPYFETNGRSGKWKEQQTRTVRFTTGNEVDTGAVKTWARYRADIVEQSEGVIKHHA